MSGAHSGASEAGEVGVVSDGQKLLIASARRLWYKQRYQRTAQTHAECFTWLRDDALIEVTLGQGKVLFNHMEATRRYGEDPVATLFLKNLIQYCMEP